MLAFSHSVFAVLAASLSLFKSNSKMLTLTTVRTFQQQGRVKAQRALRLSPLTNGQSTSSAPLQRDDSESSLWVGSKLGHCDPVVGITVPEILRQNMGSWGKLPAFVRNLEFICKSSILRKFLIPFSDQESHETGVIYTHDEILKNAEGFGAALIQSGFKRGEVVAIVLPNVPEYPSIMFGIWNAGY